MIVLNMPLKKDFYIEMFDGKEVDGFTFKFVEQKGLKLMFTCEGDETLAAAAMKKAVKASKYGQGIYFSVAVV